ncbi:Uncharacterised protein [Vibrio cholerae]|nr:Uncharacterised protein [Vibrio cholerae]
MPRCLRTTGTTPNKLSASCFSTCLMSAKVSVIASAINATTQAKPNDTTKASNTINFLLGLLGVNGALAWSVKRAIVVLKSPEALVSF